MLHVVQPLQGQMHRACALLSSDIYKEFSELPQHWGNPKHLRLISDEQTGTQVAVCYLPEVEAVMVVFRGSQVCLKDWGINFGFGMTDEEQSFSFMLDESDSIVRVQNDVKKVEVKLFHDVHIRSEKVSVHTGFLRAYESVSEQVEQAIREMCPRHAAIFVCGHSMGGALAQLCALHLNWRFTAIVFCYTYGAPRVGNKGFVRIFTRNISAMHYIHGSDVVPSLPGRWMGYRKPSSTQQLGFRIPWGIGVSRIRDHKIGRYIQALTRHTYSGLF